MANPLDLNAIFTAAGDATVASKMDSIGGKVSNIRQEYSRAVEGIGKARSIMSAATMGANVAMTVQRGIATGEAGGIVEVAKSIGDQVAGFTAFRIGEDIGDAIFGSGLLGGVLGSLAYEFVAKPLVGEVSDAVQRAAGIQSAMQFTIEDVRNASFHSTDEMRRVINQRLDSLSDWEYLTTNLIRNNIREEIQGFINSARQSAGFRSARILRGEVGADADGTSLSGRVNAIESFIEMNWRP